MVTIPMKMLRAHLATRSADQLRSDIVELVKTFDNVQEYLAAKINPASEIKVLDKYKALVRGEFVISKSGRVSLRFAFIKKCIAEFQRVSKDPRNMADLMLVVVESGVEFARKVGWINESFIDRLSSNFQRFLKYIDEHGVKDKFKDRCKRLVQLSHDIGYGFEDEIDELVEDTFPA